MTLADLRKQGVRPKYIYTIPTIQNPTGTIMPMARRHELLRLSQEYGVPICEDECYADLIWDAEAPASIQSLDPFNQVIHIGSFSKNLSPSLRLGYVLAPWEVLSQMLACKNDSGTAALGQMVVADYFQNHYQEHMDRLCTSLKHKLNTLVKALQTHFGDAVTYDIPPGGIFLWVKFPEHIDTKKVEAAASARAWPLMPARTGRQTLMRRATTCDCALRWLRMRLSRKASPSWRKCFGRRLACRRELAEAAAIPNIRWPLPTAPGPVLVAL